jgi:dUTP pyrophosphatase
MSQLHLNVKYLCEDACEPLYGSEYAAGIDVRSAVDESIPPRTRKLISTGISVSWKGCDAEHYYLRVAPRSGLAAKSCVDVGAGVVDYDYRGEVFVLLVNNHNENQFEVKKGDKIAQLIMEKINRPIIGTVTEHTETKRGSGGFGSTDVPKNEPHIHNKFY